MQNVKEVEIPIQKVISDTPAGLSELLNLRHDGEDITSLFSELGSKELFQTKGKCYGAIIHADKCYAIHKSDSDAVLVCYMNIDGEVKEVSSTPMSYNSNDLAQMFIVRNELLYLDGREYKQVELPQYTLDGQTTSTNEQKEDFVGCDKLEVSTSSGGGFAHPVKYFTRRRFSNGAVSQITGTSMSYVPTNDNLPLNVGMVSSHGFLVKIFPNIDGTIMLYRQYAGSTSLLSSIDVKYGEVFEYIDESPSLGQSIPDEGVTDTPLNNINGSSISFWNDRAIIASLSGENGESSISTSLDTSEFAIEDRATISWVSKNQNIKLNERFKYGTFVYDEKYSFVVRAYFNNRVEIFDIGSSVCNVNNGAICSITLNKPFADFLLDNKVLRVDYGYSSHNTVSNACIILPVHTIKDSNILVPCFPTDIIDEEDLFKTSRNHNQLIPAEGDTLSLQDYIDVDVYSVTTNNNITGRTWEGATFKKEPTENDISEIWTGVETGRFNGAYKKESTYSDKHLQWGSYTGSIKDWCVSFRSLRGMKIDDEQGASRGWGVGFVDEWFCLLLKPLIRVCSHILTIGTHCIGIIRNVSCSSKIGSYKIKVSNVSGDEAMVDDTYVFRNKQSHSINVTGEFSSIRKANGDNHTLESQWFGDLEPDSKDRDNYSCIYSKDEGVIKAYPYWGNRSNWFHPNYEYSRREKLCGPKPDSLFIPPYTVSVEIIGDECCLSLGDIGFGVRVGYIRKSGNKSNAYNINSSIYNVEKTATVYCEDYYDCKHIYVSSKPVPGIGANNNFLFHKILCNIPSKIPSIYRSDEGYKNLNPTSTSTFELNPIYREVISDSVFLDIESKSFVDKSINDIKIYWSLPTSNKTYKPWLSFYQESFKTLDRLGEVLKMFPFGNCLLCVCTDGIQAVFAPAHSMTGENGESIALTNAEFIPSVKTISRQPLTNNPDNVIFANDYVYILSEKQGELIIVSPNLEVKHVASVENCKLLVDSIASANKFRSENEYSFLSYHYDKNELLLCNQDRSVSYGKFGFEITSYYNTGVGIFVSGTQCIANDDNIMYKLRCDGNCKKILDKQEDISVSITLNTPYNQGLVVDGITLDTSYITHTLFDESTAKHRSYRMIAGRNGMNQDNPWQNITIANAYSSTNLPLLEKGDGRHTLYAASRFLESILRITIPRVKEVAENTMRLHGNRLYIKLHSKPKTRVMLKAISMLIHAFKR